MEAPLVPFLAFCQFCQFWHIAFPSSVKTTGSLSKFDDNGNNNVLNLYSNSFAGRFSLFFISQTFSFFPRGEMTRFAATWTTWVWWQMFNFVLLSLKRWFQFNSRIVWSHFANQMTSSNSVRNNCRNAKLHFQKTFSLWSMPYLLKPSKDVKSVDDFSANSAWLFYFTYLSTFLIRSNQFDFYTINTHLRSRTT